MKEIARKVRVNGLQITHWRREGRVIGHRSNYRTEYLYVEPTAAQIAALTGRKRHEAASQ